jgi:hypothetical protein
MSSIIKVNTVQDTDGNNIINENANTITIGKSGDTVTVASGATLLGGGIEWQSTIVTGATHTASANQGLWLDTSSNAITLTLPASPSVGDELIFSDFKRQWGSNAVTLNLNGSNFQGNATPVPIYDTTGETVHIVYSGSTQGWIPINDGAVALETPQSYSASYLVVAGGGSGGNGDDRGGGGGAGGYLTNVGGAAITLTGGQVYTITIGQGGAAATTGSPWSEGSDGNNSVLSGPGISTVTATGGGGGGGGTTNSGIGRAGGSGGGGASTSGSGTGAVGGAGTSPQGNNGGQGSNTAPYYGSAGGGGAGAVGGDGGSNNAGAGGDGNQNSITGSAVYYAGGGGGCTDSGSPAQPDGAGGQGGGGAGNGGTSGNATAGTANTGGGGGGKAQATPAASSGAGGSGVVILSVPDGNYSGTTTGSPTVATGVSGQTVITFTGSGSYTA